MSAQINAKVAKAGYTAFNERTAERWASENLAADAEWTNMAVGATFRGHDGYRQYVQGWLAAFQKDYPMWATCWVSFSSSFIWRV